MKTTFKHLETNTDHYKLSAALKSGYDLKSTLVVREHLASNLIYLPDYATVETHIIVSIVEEDARKMIGDRYSDESEAVALLKTWGVDFSKGNASTKEEDHKHKFLLVDKFFEMEVRALYPEVIAKYKEWFKVTYNEDTDEETPKSEQEFQETWPLELKRLLAPRTATSWERRYDLMPTPYSHWDGRNVWQQYFFVTPKIDPSVTYYTRGGSGGSGQRHDQGLMAHTFCTLDDNSPIPTQVYLYTKHNAFVLQHEYESFHCIDRELSGNYQITLDEKTRLPLAGKLLSLDYETLTFSSKDSDLTAY